MWFHRQIVFPYGDEFRERADTILANPGIDLVAGFESLDARAPPNDHPRQLVAEDERQSIGQELLEFSVPDLGIQRVHARGLDLNQDIALANIRSRYVAHSHA